MSFEHLGLTPELLRAVEAQGYTEPTPVQAESIPIVLARRDLLAGAQTGTGKTAAFVLPILQILNEGRPEPRPLTGPNARPRGASGLPIRCLVLTPTRELALQIEESCRVYGGERKPRSTTIYGGVGFQPQVKNLRNGPEIVVATPGRLLDHATQGTIDLRNVEILVLDEADRMLDMGFIRDIRRILTLLPAKRQNLLFSATFSDEIRELAADFLTDPAYVQIARRNAPIELVRQVVYPVDRERKRELLSHLIAEGRIDKALIFTRTKHGADRLADQLIRDGIEASAIHGNKSQGQRVRALDDFKAGRVNFLVATEVASRGLDIEGLPHVVNFELPMVASDYVHRIGRTGRAGMEGDAVSLVCVDELGLLREIETLLRTPIARETVEGFAVDKSIRPEPILQRSAGRGRQLVRQPIPHHPMADRSIARPMPVQQPYRVLADRSLADRSLADRSLADRPLADQGRPLADRPLAAPAHPIHVQPMLEQSRPGARPFAAPSARPMPGSTGRPMPGSSRPVAASRYGDERPNFERPSMARPEPRPQERAAARFDRPALDRAPAPRPAIGPRPSPAQAARGYAPGQRPAPEAYTPNGRDGARPEYNRSQNGDRPSAPRPATGGRSFDGGRPASGGRSFDGPRSASGGRPLGGGRPQSGGRPGGSRPASGGRNSGRPGIGFGNGRPMAPGASIGNWAPPQSRPRDQHSGRSGSVGAMPGERLARDERAS
jgi:ATP-dependent RNA helicase RhlE